MRIAFALFLGLHGIAHLPGMLSSWRLKTFADLPYHTTVLGGRWDVGDGGTRVLGALWVLAAVGFWVAAAGALADRDAWPGVAAAAAVGSLALCVLAWPEARFGVFANVAILLVLALAARAEPGSALALRH